MKTYETTPVLENYTWKSAPLTCIIETCDRPSKTRGYCGTHYQRKLKAGELPIVRKYKTSGPRLDDLTKRLKKTLKNIDYRCNHFKDKKFKYYGLKGVRNYLTIDDLKFLWSRDKADLMKQPSIDRINTTQHYRLSNCQFLEMSENRRKRAYPIRKALDSSPPPQT